MLPTHRECCKSNYKLHCFVCDRTINRGDEISQVLESGGMEMRRVPYSGSRWVHSTCFPKDDPTLYYLELINRLAKSKPDLPYNKIIEIVENATNVILEK
jgi:hypothetical protein